MLSVFLELAVKWWPRLDRVKFKFGANATNYQ